MRKKDIPEELYEAFHTLEPVTSLAPKYDLSITTVIRGWKSKFGETAYQERCAKVQNIRTPEQRIEDKRKRASDYYYRNKDEINGRRKLAWVEIQRDPIRHQEECQARRQNYFQNKETINLVRRENYSNLSLDQKSQLRKKNRDFRLANPQWRLYHSAKSRARNLNIEFNLTLEGLQQLIANTNGVCPITLKPFSDSEHTTSPEVMSIDRILPNVGYVITNVRIISHQANSMKSDCENPEIFRRLALYVEGNLPQPEGLMILEEGERKRRHMISLGHARRRAKRENLPCTLTKQDIRELFQYALCPITLQPYQYGTKVAGPNSPSLDRINPALGYTRENCLVISFAANTYKQGCTDPAVFRRLADYIEGNKNE